MIFNRGKIAMKEKHLYYFLRNVRHEMNLSRRPFLLSNGIAA